MDGGWGARGGVASSHVTSLSVLFPPLLRPDLFVVVAAAALFTGGGTGAEPAVVSLSLSGGLSAGEAGRGEAQRALPATDPSCC